MKHYFSCLQGIIKQSKAYAMTLDCNAIWMVDFQQRKAETIKWLDNSSILSPREYLTVCQMEDSLVLVPAKSDHMALYDFSKDTLTYAGIVQPKIITNEIYSQEKKFWGGFSSNDNVYLLGASYPAILKFNVGNGQTSYLDSWAEELQDMIPENDTLFYFAHGYLMDKGNVYIPGRASGAIFGLNLLTDQVTVYAKHNNIKMLHGIVQNGEQIWVLASMDNRESLFSWSPENGFMDEIIIEKNRLEDIYWWNPLKLEGYIYLFQMNGNAVYKVDMQKKMAEPCEEITNSIGDIPETTDRYSVILIGKEEEKIFFHTRWNQNWFIYHVKDQSIERFRIEISDEEYEYRYLNVLKKKPYIPEEELPLKDFLKLLEEGDFSAPS